MMKPTKLLAAIGLAALAVTGMTACSSNVTEADVNASTHRVMQGESEGFTTHWEYIDSTNNHVEMSKCEDSGFFSKNCVETSDGLARFEWSTYKGNINSEVIFFDGVELQTDCVTTGGFWGTKRLCGAGSN